MRAAASDLGRRPAIVAGLLATLAGLLFHANAYRFLCDDAFISFRYARNLADGFGLVFNPGYERVEGYTNFLWVVILAAGRLLGVAPETAANPISLALTAGLWAIVVLFAWRSRDADDPWWPVVVPPALLAATRSVAVWSTSGLETRLFEVLIVGATLRFALEIEAESSDAPRGRRVAALLFGAGALARPDGMLMGAAALAAGHAWLWLRGRRSVRAAVSDASVFALVVGAHVLWRRSYYGDWLPNTFYAKATGGTWWDMGATYATAFLVEYMAFLWIPLLAWGIVRRVRRGGGHVPVLFAAVIVPHALYIASLGGDHFEWRPFDLYFPFLFLLVGDGVRALAGASPKRPRRTAGLVAWVVVVVLGLIWIPALSHAQFPRDYRAGFPGLQRMTPAAARFLDPTGDPLLRWYPMRPVAAWYRGALDRLTGGFVGIRQEEHEAFYREVVSQASLLERLIANGTLPADAHVAMSCVGVIPYVTNLRTLDRHGLTDRSVARSPSGLRRAMAHEKHATLEYAAAEGVDFWAEDPVRSVIPLADPRLLELVQNALGEESETYFADVEGGCLMGRFPSGLHRARARFPSLTFRTLRDPEAVRDLRARATAAYRASLADDSPDAKRLDAADLAAKGRIEEAVAAYRDLERAGDFQGAMALGTLLASRGRYGEAAASFERAVRLQPGEAAAHADLGVAMAKLERWAPAADALSRAIALDPTDARARYWLGVSALGLGRPDVARGEAAALRAIGSNVALRFAAQLDAAAGGGGR